MTYYDTISSGYDELHGEEQKRKVRSAKEMLRENGVRINKGSLILDVGAGTGISSDFPCRVISIDPSVELVAQCQALHMQGIGEALPFKDNMFDLVLCMTAIHNFSDWKKGIEEMMRVAKDKMIISVLKKSAHFIQISDALLPYCLAKRDDPHDEIFLLAALKKIGSLPVYEHYQ
ncbi:class I SAM-dependent methyltransferase [Candidatus Woesearchaeota archaeon]|nr:class I SAM-dependent methyltransferase [Candidatus Woesearchaeota archaeon]HIH38093.1 class I SAM-dependent methyltransferase [Candidatus Woesearchaeota archaeon]HIH48359.1 class I SAM-dependent methyltransferase [Candidatus Woesearchaeota archaeon]HIJ03174.1 class I SAM-dependent methyltransferase [Candidatus Woesearchaeota archaeon]